MGTSLYCWKSGVMVHKMKSSLGICTKITLQRIYLGEIILDVGKKLNCASKTFIVAFFIVVENWK